MIDIVFATSLRHYRNTCGDTVNEKLLEPNNLKDAACVPITLPASYIAHLRNLL
jgi:hypothetical protein